MSPKEASAATSLSRVTLSNLAEAGMFPKPVRLGAKRLAFVRAEVQAWIEAKIAARASA
jgi:prophage regulatory protein